MDAAIRRIKLRRGRKLIKSATRENDVHRCAIPTLTQILDGGFGGGVNKPGGAQFGFEKGIAAVTINIVHVSAEAEWNIGKPAEHGGGGCRASGANTVQNRGPLAANKRGAAESEDHSPKRGQEVFAVGEGILPAQTPRISQQRGVAQQFAREGNEELSNFPPAEVMDCDIGKRRDEIVVVEREQGMYFNAQTLAGERGNFAPEKGL